jgi:glycosyltransferase involved in cell wall biosynthesis
MHAQVYSRTLLKVNTNPLLLHTQVYSHTLLNFHPCIYDAYGMTVVEAAAFSVPSVINKGTAGAVGAADLLRLRDGLAIGVNLEKSIAAIAEAVKGALLDR